MKKLFVLGDSTTFDYPQECFPQQGWAHYLRDYLNEHIDIINVAHGGFSLRHFIYSEDYQSGKVDCNEPEKSIWHNILSQVQSGDYFIFYWAGINDMGQICNDSYREKAGGEYIRDDFFKDKDVFMNVGAGYGTHTFFTMRTTPAETTEILSHMIKDVKDKGAEVIVAKGTGKYYMLQNNDKCVFSACHNFSSAVCDAAKISLVPFINVADTFEENFATIGYRAMIDKYFMSKNASQKFLGADAPNLDADDNTHTNVVGAGYLCSIFIDKLKKSDSTLKNYLK